MEHLLESKITNPGVTNWQPGFREGKIMSAIVDLFTMENQQRQQVGGDDYNSWAGGSGGRSQDEEDSDED